MPRQLLVTPALPYANGEIHLGHLVGYIQADIWVRAQRLYGNTVHFVCADDTHGTPIMLAAEKAGVAPETFVADVQKRHEQDFHEFGVAFDHFHSTHSPENQRITEQIYATLSAAGAIAKRSIQQLYDPEKQMFLPDRFVQGNCPKCGSADQYGDNCEVCGATYQPTELKNPRSVLSGATPILRDSEHYFFELGQFQAFLHDWLSGDVAPAGVKAKLREWFEGGLRPWDISRDAPYFGFEIPGTRLDGVAAKYFYVWLDAPIGYLAAFDAFCQRSGVSYDAFIGANSTAELHHFIGKDIVNFHGLFWPAVLKGAGLRTPTKLHVNGYLMVNGEKMSKSRGTFIMARTYLNQGLNPECLRYYFASKSGGGVDDIDLNLTDFAQRVNAELVGKLVNIASRCAGFVHAHFDGILPTLDSGELDYLAAAKRLELAAAPAYEAVDFSYVLREVMAVADSVNAKIADAAPWKLAKALAGGVAEPNESAETSAKLAAIVGYALNMYRLLVGWLKPVVPQLALASEAFLCAPLSAFSALLTPLPPGHRIAPFTPLLQRIESSQLDAMVAASRDSLAAKSELTPAKSTAKVKVAPAAIATDATAAGSINLEDFTKVELKIARILSAELVPEADKLLRLQLDIGGAQPRQVFAGIKSSYAPEALVGRLTLMVANLAPRKMRFGISEGMVLAASDAGGGPFLLSPDAGAQPGMRVK
jgi:methionyl-tRNA synthetase